MQDAAFSCCFCVCKYLLVLPATDFETETLLHNRARKDINAAADTIAAAAGGPLLRRPNWSGGIIC